MGRMPPLVLGAALAAVSEATAQELGGSSGWRHVVIEVGQNESVAEAARRRSDLFETVRNLPDGSVLLASRGLADVIAFESVEHQPHHALPLSVLIAPPTPPQKLRRRSKRAQRARRHAWL